MRPSRGSDASRPQIGPRCIMHVVRLTSVFECASPGQQRRFDPVGGMQVHTASLTRAIDGLGPRQTVITAYRPGEPRRERIGRCADLYRVGAPIGAMRQAWAGPALARALGASSVDIVHAHLGEDIAVLPLAAVVAARHRAPLVVTVHASPWLTVEPVDRRARAIHSLGGAAERWILPSASRVLTLTERTAGLLRLRLPRDVVDVIPLGVDVAAFAAEHTDPLPGIGHPRVVCIARLVRAKGVDVLLRAMSTMPGAALVVLGDGPERADLLALATDLRLDDRVHLPGSVPRGSVPAHVAHADVVVMPSRYEEAGRGIVEAMAAGAPVVASGVGGIPAIVRAGVNGLLVPPDDPAALASAIDRVISQPAFARTLAA
jgi:glycogen synthase